MKNEISDDQLVALLQIECEHSQKIGVMETVLETGSLDKLDVELHHIVFDIVGVPSDTTMESEDGFCRDWLTDEWHRITIFATSEMLTPDFHAFLNWVRREIEEWRRENNEPRKEPPNDKPHDLRLKETE